MGPLVSVIARVESGGAWLPRLVDSVDTQTLGTDAFETVYVVSASAPRAAARLAGLAERRPNVRVVGSLADADVRGRWVLDLGPHLHRSKPALVPTALADLTGFAQTHGCEAVLGRAATRSGRLLADAFAEPSPAIGARPAPDDLGPALALLPAHLLDRAEHPADPVATALDRPGPVGCLGPRPVATVRAEPGGEVPATEVTEVLAAWTGDSLALTVRGRHPDAADGARTLLSLRARDGREVWPSGGATSYGADHSFEHITLVPVPDLADQERGGPGLWDVQVGVHRPGTGLSRRSPLPQSRPPAAPAVVGDVLVVPTAGGSLTLDVGATRSSLVTGLAPATATLHEDAAGTLLTLDLDHVHVHGEGRLTGSVVLDDFPLLAHLVTDDGRARVEGYVSGLPGRSSLGTQFGRGRAAASGLDLVIAPVGAMTVAPAAGGPAPVRTGVGPSHGAAPVHPQTAAAAPAADRRTPARTLPRRARALAGRVRRKARSTLARRG